MTDATGGAAELTATERRRRIVASVAEQGFVTISDLADRFHVSVVTVRSDVDRLAERGDLRRIRGGVMATSPSQPERSFEETATTHSAEKAALGRSAAALVRSGSTVVLDVGTTTTAVAGALCRRTDLTGVTVVTNGLTIAAELEPASERFTVMLTGGTLRRMQHSLVDPMGGLLLERIHADLAIIGCNGVDPEAGVTNVNLPEVAMKQRMLAAGRRRVVVADGSKIGVVSVAHVCAVDDVDLVLTGASAPPEAVEQLRGHDVEVEVVDAAPDGIRVLAPS
ncbi:DeoR/GlpR family DNA-binding transcription regulator [Nocardioides sp. T2.26MG-1]|uniref:DeoR/GlpR family DNA-binding transcription regulator n=1 Tax=Nocardioides sp. T2.26MG-1 TaxID=3041166 RepID=UPI0024774784|nr:DeoR/GlpR family DNA-binding transcription regulator [Nocardioides sp. T2.26MG-1]CAI9419209.1 Glycerol-3-phosphate regulon repressor [Nocardioides sp. T2.26MG-1]